MPARCIGRVACHRDMAQVYALGVERPILMRSLKARLLFMAGPTPRADALASSHGAIGQYSWIRRWLDDDDVLLF